MTSRPWRLLSVALSLGALCLTDGCGKSAPSPSTSSQGGVAGSGGSSGASNASGGTGVAGQGGKAGATGTGGQGTAAGGGSSAGTGGQGGQGGPKMLGCTGLPRPATVPEDWIEYTGWDCMCPLYAPGNSKIRPPKIEWGPCDFKLPESFHCQRTVKPGNGWMAVSNYSAEDPQTGEMIFQTGFSEETVEKLADIKTTHVVVAKENGETISHFFQVLTKKCGFTGTGLSQNNLILQVNPKWDDTIEGAAAANLTDIIPTREMKFPSDPALGSNWTIAPSWIIRKRGDRTAFRWDDPDDKGTLIYSAPMLGRAGHKVIPQGDDIFIQIGEIHTGGVAVWTEKEGTRPLILWPANTRTVHHFDTDGKTHVWTEAEGWNNNTTTFAQADVFVAPYTLDQTKVTQTRKKLTKDLNVLSGTPWKVGCGYAARKLAASTPLSNSLMVVRLSDGTSWLLPGGDPSQPWRYDFLNAFGLTCTHIYTTVALPSGAPTIARIRLDSLGPGTPPSE